MRISDSDAVLMEVMNKFGYLPAGHTVQSSELTLNVPAGQFVPGLVEPSELQS